jgi:Leucine-rich repeat (LRR) protein
MIYSGLDSGGIGLSLNILTLNNIKTRKDNLMKPLIRVFFVLTCLAGLVFPSASPVIAQKGDGRIFVCDSSVTSISKDQCTALVKLYYSTNGDEWTDNTNWLQNSTPENWAGVYITAGHVLELNLSNNHLVGNLPDEMGDLAFLERLDLSKNQLTGSIPPELAKRNYYLQYLDLSNNQLTGGIPAEFGENGDVAGLERIDLSHNQLTGRIPAELGNLRALAYLNLSHNQLVSSFGPHAIPKELFSSFNLWWLDLSDNRLTGSIEPGLAGLYNLKSLYLYSNQLTGGIPKELGNLSKLQWLMLSDNRLDGNIPVELTKLINLRGLGLHTNQLTGEIPSELEKLTNLEVLYLDYNQLTGSIPPELSNLTKLEWLHLDNNQLTGSIPPELGKLTKLNYLWLHNNRLSGFIPSELTALTQFCLPANAASPCFNQQGLRLGYNRLSIHPFYNTDVVRDYLKIYDPDWQLTQGVANLISQTGGSMISNDGKTSLTFPSGSVSQSMDLVYVPMSSPTRNLGQYEVFANLSFYIEVNEPAPTDLPLASGSSVYVFGQPVSATISYSDSDLVNIQEDALALDYWDGSQWVDAAQTCSTPAAYTRDAENNTLSLQICKAGEFALAGRQSFSVFIPSVLKQ